MARRNSERRQPRSDISPAVAGNSQSRSRPSRSRRRAAAMEEEMKATRDAGEAAMEAKTEALLLSPPMDKRTRTGGVTAVGGGGEVGDEEGVGRGDDKRVVYGVGFGEGVHDVGKVGEADGGRGEGVGGP
ncbi:hypothetical protein HPP92_017744 [Vanilla planifolia]|uniref:Uncharacterized protein n=1 Tax=Vanilla planifolia TaxID=51239 RepID=A0A835UQV2_VANPL|nr:hypothetical protein HPP92_017744 [Vanilla planifolia]